MSNNNTQNDERIMYQLVIRRIFFSQICLIVLAIIFVIAGVIFTQLLGSFQFAFLCGALGGSLALLRRLRAEKFEALVELQSSVITTIMPMLYGGILASIAYLLFMSNILTGDGGGGLFTSNLFPNFGVSENIKSPSPGQGSLTMDYVLEIRPREISDFAKLLVWSFLAGYSESFVTGILASLEKTSSKSTP